MVMRRYSIFNKPPKCAFKLLFIFLILASSEADKMEDAVSREGEKSSLFVPVQAESAAAAAGNLIDQPASLERRNSRHLAGEEAPEKLLVVALDSMGQSADEQANLNIEHSRPLESSTDHYDNQYQHSSQLEATSGNKSNLNSNLSNNETTSTKFPVNMTGTINNTSRQNESSSSNSNDEALPLELSAFEAAKRGYFRHSMLISVILTVAYSIVFVVGIIGNSFVVAIVCKSPRMRTVTNYFIANLAFADILVLLFCLPATLVGNLFIPYVLGLFVCKTVSYLQGIAVSASINTMVTVTMDRFLAIYFPMYWHMSRRTARWIIACIWLFSACISCPWAIFFTLVPYSLEQTTIQVCAEDWPSERWGNIYFVCANLILLYLLPATVIILCYLGIWYKIERRNIPGEGPKGLKIELIMQRSKLKVVKMMMVVVVIFLLSWLPLYLIFARIKLFDERSQWEDMLITNLMPLAQWLGASNSCINPILYTFFNRKYKRGFADLLRFAFCCPSARNANNNSFELATGRQANNKAPRNNGMPAPNNALSGAGAGTGEAFLMKSWTSGRQNHHNNNNNDNNNNHHYHHHHHNHHHQNNNNNISNTSNQTTTTTTNNNNNNRRHQHHHNHYNRNRIIKAGQNPAIAYLASKRHSTTSTAASEAFASPAQSGCCCGPFQRNPLESDNHHHHHHHHNHLLLNHSNPSSSITAVTWATTTTTTADGANSDSRVLVAAREGTPRSRTEFGRAQRQGVAILSGSTSSYSSREQEEEEGEEEEEEETEEKEENREDQDQEEKRRPVVFRARARTSSDSATRDSAPASFALTTTTNGGGGGGGGGGDSTCRTTLSSQCGSFSSSVASSKRRRDHKGGRAGQSGANQPPGGLSLESEQGNKPGRIRQRHHHHNHQTTSSVQDTQTNHSASLSDVEALSPDGGGAKRRANSTLTIHKQQQRRSRFSCAASCSALISNDHPQQQNLALTDIDRPQSTSVCGGQQHCSLLQGTITRVANNSGSGRHRSGAAMSAGDLSVAKQQQQQQKRRRRRRQASTAGMGDSPAKSRRRSSRVIVQTAHYKLVNKNEPLKDSNNNFEVSSCLGPDEAISSAAGPDADCGPKPGLLRSATRDRQLDTTTTTGQPCRTSLSCVSEAATAEAETGARRQQRPDKRRNGARSSFLPPRPGSENKLRSECLYWLMKDGEVAAGSLRGGSLMGANRRAGPTNRHQQQQHQPTRGTDWKLSSESGRLETNSPSFFYSSSSSLGSSASSDENMLFGSPTSSDQEDERASLRAQSNDHGGEMCQQASGGGNQPRTNGRSSNKQRPDGSRGGRGRNFLRDHEEPAHLGTIGAMAAGGSNLANLAMNRLAVSPSNTSSISAANQDDQQQQQYQQQQQHDAG